jgi:hypothetical protein
MPRNPYCHALDMVCKNSIYISYFQVFKLHLDIECLSIYSSLVWDFCKQLSQILLIKEKY